MLPDRGFVTVNYLFYVKLKCILTYYFFFFYLVYNYKEIFCSKEVELGLSMSSTCKGFNYFKFPDNWFVSEKYNISNISDFYSSVKPS